MLIVLHKLLQQVIKIICGRLSKLLDCSFFFF
jgi:hypothetical protein